MFFGGYRKSALGMNALKQNFECTSVYALTRIFVVRFITLENIHCHF